MIKFRAQAIPTLLSRAVAILLFVALILIIPLLPHLVDVLYNTKDLSGQRPSLPEWNKTLMLVVTYAMIAVALFATVLLWLLLNVVSSARVFTTASTRLLLLISICCFAETLLFLSIQHCFELALAGAIAVAFIGLCLLVVRNVLTEAIRIKDENDLTV